MKNLSGNLKALFRKEIETETLVNIILYSVILIMPFIVVNVSSPRYVIGKLMFLYIIGIFSLYSLIKLKFTKFNLYHKLALVFLMTIFIPSILSPYKYVAFMGNHERGEGFFIYCIYILLFLLSSKYLIINKALINIVLTFSCIMGLYGVIQFYGFDPVQYWMFGKIIGNESIGFIGHRNFFSSYLCIFLFLSVSIYIFKGISKYLIYSSILFAALLCTLTRGGWLAFLIYSFIGLLFILKEKYLLKRALLVFISFTVIFGVLNLTTDNKVLKRAGREIVFSEDGELINSAGARANILKISFRAFIDKPLLGYGPDTLKNRLTDDYPEEMMEHILKFNEVVDKSHNEYLEYAVSNGIFSLLLYSIFLGAILIMLFKNRRNYISKILFLTILGYMFQGFFNISVIMVAPIFWILLGASIKLMKETNKKILEVI
ncbi:MAG: O-antigen ligase family protein [Clostridiales bacterium]|nr:O-antigen ligase family protein [Clostridiales bacterium]